MKLKALTQLFSLRDIRNAILGVVVIFGGLGLSGLTLYAHQTGNIPLAGISAGASLVFVLLILIFVVPPLARNAGREASQMNLPFEFTTGGALMLILLVIVGFSAWNTGNNLLFLVLSFLIAAMVVAFFAGSVSLKKLDVTMRFPETIFADEPTPILVGINNRKRYFPSFSIVVDVRGKERERSIAAAELDAFLPKWIANRVGRAPVVRRTLNHFIYVGAKSTVETKTDHRFPNRGRLTIKDFELSTKFPLGFFRHRRRLPAREAELIVYPQLVDVSAHVSSRALERGSKNSTKRGVGQELLALRDYQPQDDLRRIDWKASARTNQLIVREFAAEDEMRVTVIFDPRIVRADEEIQSVRDLLAAEQSGKPVIASHKFETGTSTAASILSKFHDRHAEIRLIVIGISDESGEFGSGHSHFYESLKQLSIAEPIFPPETKTSEPEADLRRILNETDDSHWFLVTANGTNGLPPDILHKLKIIGF